MKKAKQEELMNKRNEQNSDWNYEKPAYSSQIYELYKSEFENEQNSEAIKQEHAAQIQERRKFFAVKIKQNYAPKIDIKREKELKEVIEKEFTKPRQSLLQEERNINGNENLRYGNNRAKSERIKITSDNKRSLVNAENSKVNLENIEAAAKSSIGLGRQDVSLPKI